MNDRAAEALRVMRFNARIAIEYARDNPGSRSNQLVADAIAKRVEEVTDAAKYRFPRALRSEHPEIEWDLIAGMRDRLAHDYGNADLDILDQVVSEHLPRLVATVDAIGV